MSVLKPVAGLLMAASLTGCVASEGATQRVRQDIVSVTFNQNAAGLTPAGYEKSKVRVLKKRPEGVTLNAVDDVAADCTLTGKQFSARFVTPATVNIPNYGRNSQPIKLDCTYGSKTITRVRSVENLSQNQRDAKASNAVAGVVFLNPGLIAGAAASKVDVGKNGEDLYGYFHFLIEIN